MWAKIKAFLNRNKPEEMINEGPKQFEGKDGITFKQAFKMRIGTILKDTGITLIFVVIFGFIVLLANYNFLSSEKVENDRIDTVHEFLKNRENVIEDYTLPSALTSVRYEVEVFSNNNQTADEDSVIISGWAFSDYKSKDMKTYIVLKSAMYTYVVKPDVIERPDVALSNSRPDIEKSGFYLELPYSEVEEGNYVIYLYLVKKKPSVIREYKLFEKISLLLRHGVFINGTVTKEYVEYYCSGNRSVKIIKDTDPTELESAVTNSVTNFSSVMDTNSNQIIEAYTSPE